MDLHFIDGSPFARITRILAREHGLALTECEMLAFPPPDDFDDLNPLGQVPVLVVAGQSHFPTRIVIDVLLSGVGKGAGPVAGSVARTDHRVEDEQLLAVILAMGDALAAHHYLQWAGVAALSANRLGFDPAGRHLHRVIRVLDWLERRITGDGFQPGTISVQDIALACFILWSESRGPIAWRGRPGIEAMVARLQGRESFRTTAPRPHVLK